MYRLGTTLLRVEYTHPLVPGQLLVEVLDASDAAAPVQFSYQVSAADKGIALVGASDVAVPALVGPVFYYNVTEVSQSDLVAEAMGAPMDYLGNTTLAGEDVRIWALHLMNNSYVAYWYDTVETQEVRRIAFGDFGVLDVVSVTDLPGDANDNAYLFMMPDPSVTITPSLNDPKAADSLSNNATALPGRVTLDPFTPYVAAYGAAQRAVRRRRQLLQEAPRPDANYNFGDAGSNFTAMGRSLKQINALGCAANNKCPIKPGIFPGGGNYNNLAVTIAVPAFPLGLALGPVSRIPCMYEISASVSPTQVLIPLPITITGTLGVLLCSDMTSYEQVYASLAVAVGIPGIPKGSPLELVSWQIASVGISQINEGQELMCQSDGGNGLSYGAGDEQLLAGNGVANAGMLSAFSLADSLNNCQCLRNTQFRNGIGFDIGGPDIPGFVLLSIPILGQALIPVAPFLAFVKLRPTAGMQWCACSCSAAPERPGIVLNVPRLFIGIPTTAECSARTSTSP
jgi:hypothetical protein